MDLQERINSFAYLGETLREFLHENKSMTNAVVNGRDRSLLYKLIEKQHKHNPWFTPENVKMAIAAIANELTEANLIRWTNAYPGLHNQVNPIRVGVIMAGNIPLAGFHDFLSVLISGNNIIAKTSSKDDELIAYISDILCSIDSRFRNRIEFTSGILTNFNAVIATGSDNSSRYFEYYIGNYPHIIRRNRNSIAIIEGDESDEELEDLGIDIFSYFGLGCRNVSKIYFPAGYDLVKISECWNNFRGVINHSKYKNNYDYNKAVYMVNKEVFHDSGFLLLKEDRRISSPVSVLYYENYESLDAVKQQTDLLKKNIQCIIGKHNIPFGKSQKPHLWDYADGIDTLEFLLKKKLAGIL